MTAATWPETLAELVEVVAASLTRTGPADPEAAARAVALDLGTWMGGSARYLPRGRRLRLAARDLSIYRDHRRGATTATLAARHRLTPRQVRRILADQAAIHARLVHPVRLADRAERDRRMIADRGRGDSLPVIARRYGVSYALAQRVCSRTQ